MGFRFGAGGEGFAQKRNNRGGGGGGGGLSWARTVEDQALKAALETKHGCSTVENPEITSEKESRGGKELWGEGVTLGRRREPCVRTIDTKESCTVKG